jgi:hypothetical protein
MAATSHSVKNKIFKYYNNIRKEKYLLLICNRSRHDYVCMLLICNRSRHDYDVCVAYFIIKTLKCLAINITFVQTENNIIYKLVIIRLYTRISTFYVG